MISKMKTLVGLKPKEPVDPQVKAEAIVSKANADATVKTAKRKVSAQKKLENDAYNAERRAANEKRRVEANRRPFTMTWLVLWLVKLTAWGAVLAAAGFIAVGFLFDIVFYGNQSTDLVIVCGLIVFAAAVRLTVVCIPVVLQFSKPEKTPGERHRVWSFLTFWDKKDDYDKDAGPSTGMMAVIEKNQLARMTLRLLFLIAIVMSFVATLSFFSAGHETRTFQTEQQTTVENTAVTSKQARIDALEKQRTDAKETRDTSIAASERTLKLMQDSIPGFSRADNATVQKITNDIAKYTSDYQAKSDEIDGKINAINQETETVAVAAAEKKAATPTFLSVYRFLGKAFAGEEAWTIGGAWFFSIAFELFIAFLLGALFVLLKGLSYIARLLQARDQENMFKWETRFEQLDAEAKLNRLQLQAAAAEAQAEQRLRMALAEAERAERQAEVDRQIAESQRRVRRAERQAEAAREGKPFVDEDAEIEAAKLRDEALQEERIAQLRAEANEARARAAEALKPKPAPVLDDPGLTPKQQGSRKGGNSTAYGHSMGDNIVKFPVDDWSDRDAAAQAMGA